MHPTRILVSVVEGTPREVKFYWKTAPDSHPGPAANSPHHRIIQFSSIAQSCPTLCDPTDYTVHRILQARILEWVAFPFSRDLPNSGTEPRSPALQADSLPAEPPGKPKNTRVGSLSLLQGYFPTQVSCIAGRFFTN